MREMAADINSGNRTRFESKDYYHNQVINQLFKEVKKKAWLDLIQTDPDIQRLIDAEQEKLAVRRSKFFTSAQNSSVLNMYK